MLMLVNSIFALGKEFMHHIRNVIDKFLCNKFFDSKHLVGWVYFTQYAFLKQTSHSKLSYNSGIIFVIIYKLMKINIFRKYSKSIGKSSG